MKLKTYGKFIQMIEPSSIHSFFISIRVNWAEAQYA